MSLITEEKREELGNKPIEELVKLIKEKRPEKKDAYALRLARCAKKALTKELFWKLADLSKNRSEKAEDLKRSIGIVVSYRTPLIVLGTIKPYEKTLLYTKDVLVKADKRFPGRESLRKAINRDVEVNEELTVGQIADRLDIPKIVVSGAEKGYGIKYRAYENLLILLRFEAEEGNLERKKEKNGKYRYTLVRKLLLDQKKLYTKDVLVKVDKKFPNMDALREAINRHMKEKEELTVGQIADRLGIPKIRSFDAVKVYGTKYQAYTTLKNVLNFEAKKGNLERKKDRRYRYRLVRKLPLGPKSRKKVYIEVVDRKGPCTIKDVQKGLGILAPPLTYLKGLDEEGEVTLMKGPDNNTKYSFFNVIFPKKGKGYLVLNPKNQDHLEKMSERMFGCLPNPIQEWYLGHLHNQLDELRRNGLPGEVYEEVDLFLLMHE